MKNIVLILCASFLSVAQAQQSYKPVRVNLGVFYSYRNVYRGALIWDAPILAAGPSLTLFDFISLGAGGLSFFKRFGDLHTATIGFSYFDDNEPSGPVLKLKDSVEDYKNQRSATYGSYLKYDFRFRQFVAFSSELHRDFKRHEGLYSYSRLSTSILPFLTFGIGYGLGEKNSNRYVYGPEASSGSAHFDFFTSLMLPILPWQGRLMLNYSKTSISQMQNVNADYIRGHKENEQFSVGAMWSL